MVLSNTVILTAYHYILQSSADHLDNWYEAYYNYGYGEGTILDYYNGDAASYYDYDKPDSIIRPSTDKVIVAAVFVASSLVFDLFWIFLLRPEI